MLKHNLNLNRLTTLLLTTAVVFTYQAALPARSAQEAASESQLIDKLINGANQKEKADACRELAHLGTKNAVPSLAPLLADEQLGHMARYALETIPDPSVDAALREALGKVKGRLLAGVIGSIGVR